MLTADKLMEILQKTPTQLTLGFRPWHLWIYGGLSLVGGLVMAFVIVFPISKTNTFTCVRSQPSGGNCQLVSSTLLQSHVKTIPLKELQGARFNKVNNSNGNPEPRVVLLTSQGEVPFPFIRSYHPTAQHTQLKWMASEINSFVKKPDEQSLTVEEGDLKTGWVICAFFGLNLVWFVFEGAVVTCRFDKTLGSMTTKKQWWLVTKTIEKPLREIVDVQVQERHTRSGKIYRISLVLASGKRLSLTPYHPNPGSKKKQTQETADFITKFLNLKAIDNQEQDFISG